MIWQLYQRIRYHFRLKRRLREIMRSSEAVWAYLEAQPGFNEQMAQAEADFRAGRGTTLHEIRR